MSCLLPPFKAYEQPGISYSVTGDQIGMTPHHYLTELRMQESWRLLEQTDLNIQRMADSVGLWQPSSRQRGLAQFLCFYGERLRC